MQSRDTMLLQFTTKSQLSAPWVAVYPNPAAYSTSVDIRSVTPGDYEVSVISANGSLQYRQQVEVDQSGELLRAIPLGRIATGYYLVQLRSGNQIVMTYPLVVVH